ncbi:MYB-LIKE PROTEIN X [Salix koriyanagi]|uniref:MYB-LIKE PROTEIN X n=1 Tax=Salix koriyanagi TaxID=2511006 RepID=A0A9Q0PMX8_9ROSI|nr:MYB-LIKE PROTEIN X [Salix koriyanagi]
MGTCHHLGTQELPDILLISWIKLRAGFNFEVLICLEDKEKKNKEKKDKEKKEKDRSDGKHRDKKDKKEKHREKKEKDRDKDKDKSSTSDEKRLLGQAVHNNGGDRASDERKVPGQSNGGEVCTQKRKERDHDKNSISGNKNNPGQFSVCNGQKLIQTSNVSHQLEESKFVQQLGKRAREEDRKQFFEKFTSTDAKRDEGMVRLVAKVPGNWVEGKEKNKRDDDRTVDGQGIKDEARFTASPQRISKAKIDGMPISLEKDNEKKMEGKEKTKQKESDDKRKNREKKSKEKDKVRDREKKSREKDKVRDKEKKKEEKAKEKNEHKMKEPVKLKENNMFDLVLDNTVKSSHLIKESTNSVVGDINIKKRKDSNANGLLHADDIKPNKLPRPTSSLPVSVENGRMLGTCQIPTSAIQGRQEAVNSDKVDSKEQKINGLIEAVAPPITSTNHLLSASLTKSLTKPSNSTAQTDQIAEVSRKQPHPDSKYLLEVLTVPKMEDWSDFEDQEWLFQSTYSQTKKPQVEVSGVDETQQVWSEALQIESADVYALPYVIPY